MLVALAALAAVQAGRWKDTETLFTYTLSVNPASAVAEYHLGIDLALEGKHAEAADRFSEALAVHPEFAEIHVELGRSLLALGRTADGIDELERALALNPDNLDAHLNLGEAMESQGKTEEARREYEAVLSIRPDVAMAHYNLGNLALRESGPQGGPQRPIGPERLAEAEAHFRAALRANRMHAKAHARLGMVLLARGRVLEAVEHERAALAIDPTLVEAVAALRFAVEQIPADSDRARQVERLLRKYDEPK
jgi:tetratricopeptide (TPR) repeat protein